VSLSPSIFILPVLCRFHAVARNGDFVTAGVLSPAPEKQGKKGEVCRDSTLNGPIEVRATVWRQNCYGVAFSIKREI
jgi:hypothetical protein